MSPIHRRGRRETIRQLWDEYAHEPAQPCEYLGVEPIRSDSPDGIFDNYYANRAALVQWPRALIAVEVPKVSFNRTSLHPRDPRRRHSPSEPCTCSTPDNRRDVRRKIPARVIQWLKDIPAREDDQLPPAPVEATTPARRLPRVIRVVRLPAETPRGAPPS